MPPSTGMLAPRIQALASDSRKAMTGAMSRGVPGRSMVRASSSARAPSVCRKSFRMGVSTGPGLTAFMRMPRWRHVQRWRSVQATSASLLKK